MLDDKRVRTEVTVWDVGQRVCRIGISAIAKRDSDVPAHVSQPGVGHRAPLNHGQEEVVGLTPEINQRRLIES